MLAAVDAIVTTLVTIATFVVAMLVYVEARRIRRTEGIFRQNQAWNDFGNSVAEFHTGSRIEALLTGKGTGPDCEDDLTLVEKFLLMSFFNVVSSEYNAVCAKVIDEKYVMHSFVHTHGVLRRNQAWIFDFLKNSGYEASFIRCLRAVEREGPQVEPITRAIKAELCSASAT